MIFCRRGGNGEWSDLMKRLVEDTLRWKKIEENEQKRGGYAGRD